METPMICYNHQANGQLVNYPFILLEYIIKNSEYYNRHH